MANDACSSRVGVQHDSAACARPGPKYYYNDQRYTLSITLYSSSLWQKRSFAHVIFMYFAAILSSANSSLGPVRFAVLPHNEDEVRGFDPKCRPSDDRLLCRWCQHEN